MDAAVGIITRTKDRPVLLKRAIESIVNQSYDDWRMVIVNDGGAASQVDSLVERFGDHARGRISVIHNPESLGMEAASNRGIAAVQTKYLAIHDDDDTWSPEFLAIAVAELEAISETFPTVAGVITLANAVFERVEGNVVHIDRVEPYCTSDKRGLVSLDELLTENQFAPIQFLFRYDAAREVGFFRPELPVLGDWDFNVRFMCRHDIFIIPQFLAFYHHRSSDQTVYGNTVFADRSRHDLFATVLKNSWLRQDIQSHGTGVGAHVTVRQSVHRLRQATGRIQQTTENIRQTTEDYRQTTENIRQTTEDNRQTTENIRQTTENIRQTTENIRQTTEDNRQTTENIRQTTENIRQTTEYIQQGTDRLREDMDGIYRRLDSLWETVSAIDRALKEPGKLSRRFRNSVQLIRLWAASGKQWHYAGKFFRLLFSRGPLAALRKVKSWFFSQHGD